MPRSETRRQPALDAAPRAEADPLQQYTLSEIWQNRMRRVIVRGLNQSTSVPTGAT